MTRNEYTVDELADVLLRAGFVECNIAACNCGSWHHRYGLPERFSEIKDALMDAGVLNNETGNLPIRAIEKLVEQRDALSSRLAEAEVQLTAERYGHEQCHKELLEAEQDAARYRWLRDNKFSGPGVWVDSDDGIRHVTGEQADRTVDAAKEGGK